MNRAIRENKLFNNIKNVLIKTPYFVCNQCYIRGSYAKQTNTNKSDIDLLVISQDFQRISFHKRKELIYKAMKELENRIEVDAICLSDDEYSKLINEKRKMLCEERMIRIL